MNYSISSKSGQRIMNIDREVLDVRMKYIAEEARQYAEKAKEEWIKTYVGPHGFTYEDGEAFIRDPLKYEKSRQAYKDAYREYLDMHTIRVPKDMVVVKSEEESDPEERIQIIKDSTGKITIKRVRISP
jgi:hypothetical protein